MSAERSEISIDARTRKAVAELEGMIARRYPSAIFELSHPEDEPTSIEITAIVDVDDPDEVLEHVIERVVELQVEEGVPIHVVPIPTPERVEAYLHERRTGARGPRRAIRL